MGNIVIDKRREKVGKGNIKEIDLPSIINYFNKVLMMLMIIILTRYLRKFIFERVVGNSLMKDQDGHM